MLPLRAKRNRFNVPISRVRERRKVVAEKVAHGLCRGRFGVVDFSSDEGEATRRSESRRGGNRHGSGGTAAGSNCGLAKGGCYLNGAARRQPATRTGLKSRRYLLFAAVTSFNSYQFHGHTSLPVDTMVTSGELGATASRTSIRADDKYLIVREKEVYWTPVETGAPTPISLARANERRSPYTGINIHVRCSARLPSIQT